MAHSAGPTATVGDAVVVMITAANLVGTFPTHVAIINEGGAAGFFAVDTDKDGIIWRRISASSARVIDNINIVSVQIRRVASGSNMSAVFADVW